MKIRLHLRSVLVYVLLIAVIFAFIPFKLEASAYNVTSDIRSIYDIPMDLTGKTIILHTNDVHGAIGRYAYVSSVKKNLQKRGAEVILVDCGDFIQGEPYVSTSSGESAIACMNAAGYDIVTLGNHEFDYGYVQLMKDLSIAKFKVICADVFDPAGNPILDQSIVYTTKSGVKIGFVGIETPETQTKSNPANIRGLTFPTAEEMYECTQNQIEGLKEGGSDLVICMAHLGVDDVSAVTGLRSIDLYTNTNGIDLILDGHSHTVMTAAEGSIPIQSTGTKLQSIGVVVIDDASKTIEDHYLISLDGLQKEVISDAVATAVIKEIDNEYGRVFAKSEVNLNGERD